MTWRIKDPSKRKAKDCGFETEEKLSLKHQFWCMACLGGPKWGEGGETPGVRNESKRMKIKYVTDFTQRTKSNHV